MVMAIKKYFFTSESVAEGHSDKIEEISKYANQLPKA